jgi:hypothetical protein
MNSGRSNYLAVAFPADKANFSGEMASELKALIDSNTIQVLDLVILRAKTTRSRRPSCAMPMTVRSVSCARWRRTSDNRQRLAVRLLCWSGRTPGRRRFGSAVRRSGGELVTSGRIPTQTLVAAVEADRQAASEGG